MKFDYLLFGDHLVLDMTYRTNHYEMVYTPFVCINHYAKNVMVGCGLLINEKAKSFVGCLNDF